MDSDEENGEYYGEVTLYFYRTKNGVKLSHTFFVDRDDVTSIDDIKAIDLTSNSIDKYNNDLNDLITYLKTLEIVNNINTHESNPKEVSSSFFNEIDKYNDNNNKKLFFRKR